ncbi:MAG: mechanosensitive ion channel family protein [Janthinobacterium lividum]
MKDWFSVDRLQPVWNTLLATTMTYGMSVLIALALLIIGWWIASRVSGGISRLLARTHADATFAPIVSSLVMWAIRVVAIVAALGKVGIATASVLAVLGAAGLAIGLALQGTLQNIAAGLMVLLLRPFRVGDMIEGSGPTAGVVQEIGLFSTIIQKSDGNMLFVPNSQIWGNPVTNYSINGTRRFVLELTVECRENVEAALSTAKKLLADEPRVLTAAALAPTVLVANYSNDRATLKIAGWVQQEVDIEPVQADLKRRAVAAFAELGCPLHPEHSAAA